MASCAKSGTKPVEATPEKTAAASQSGGGLVLSPSRGKADGGASLLAAEYAVRALAASGASGVPGAFVASGASGALNETVAGGGSVGNGAGAGTAANSNGEAAAAQSSSAQSSTKAAASSAAQSATQSATLSAAQFKELFAAARSHGMPDSGLIIVIDVAAQKAFLYSKSGLAATYLVSTSKYGTGSAAGSNKTPLGWHKVTELFGDGKAMGTSFTSRRPDGEILPPSDWRSSKQKDYVLSRILWLTGLEPGLNSGAQIDSHARCIYLHGTNQEHLLGQPASHGCIRFSNADIMELFTFAQKRELYCLIK